MNDYFEPALPPWLDKQTNKNIDFENISDDIIHNIIETAFSRISKNFNNYEVRQSQIDLSKKILINFIHDKISVFEAGTGIGKSFAYLIAAISYSYLAGEMVLISTETKNLQLQLYEKDLPFLYQVLDPALNFQLCLGSNNYFCELRYDEANQDTVVREDMHPDLKKELKLFLNDKNKDKHFGSMYDFNIPIPYNIWSLINRDPDGCPNNKCGYYSKCNYYKAKQQWRYARLLIVNHAFLLTHLKAGKSILPAYGAFVIDEAHGFLEQSYHSFNFSFSVNTIEDKYKLVVKILDQKSNLPLEFKEELIDSWKSLEKLWKDFFGQWETHLGLNFEENKVETIAEPLPVTFDIQNLLAYIKVLNKYLKNLVEEEEESVFLNKMNHLVKFLDNVKIFFQAFQKLNFDDMIFWAEKKNFRFSLYVTFLNINVLLSDLLTEKQTWLSATLGYWPYANKPSNKQEAISRGYLTNFINNLFLPETHGIISQDIYKSPFPYYKNTILYIPSHLEIPNWKSSQDAYMISLAEEIKNIIDLSQGGTLVLFTSNQTLQLVYELLEESIEYPILSQLDLGVKISVEKFKTMENAVLLGTNSFWQGLDISGNRLRSLIITKMMFTPPNNPILKARSDILEKNNKNPFLELSLPKALLMLKQGFGRLIRSMDDTGIISILDSRLLHKFYGKILVSNLPTIEMVNQFKDLQNKIKLKGVLSNGVYINN